MLSKLSAVTPPANRAPIPGSPHSLAAKMLDWHSQSCRSLSNQWSPIDHRRPYGYALGAGGTSNAGRLRV